MEKGFPKGWMGLTYAQQPVLGLSFARVSASLRAVFYPHVFSVYFLDEFVSKGRKSLFRRVVKGFSEGFPTKLSTDFVDKNIAL
ncbi:MAG: hypothetical protein F9K21_01050 [Rhodocyclaceae bacterium]|nr:MAG: hypothetical protein F9K21_01050 [Rhodocyclaceae bacterium]MBE7423231.1 hypothetical protein [Zoogloeaceae bacterium]MCK6385090.1 hypothetical protein [Rhodocyclaceae bacterium]